MGVPTIPGADRGSNVPWTWMASNKSSNMRYGSLVGISLLTDADDLDVVVYGETISSVASGELVGVNLEGGPEPSLTTFLPVDGTGCTGIAIGSGIGRAQFILSASQTVTADNPYLIPDPANPGNVISRPLGSMIPAIARAVMYPSPVAAEQYITADFLNALSAGLLSGGKQTISCDATDTVTTNYYVPKSGVHVNPGAAKNTPVVFGPAVAKTVITVSAAACHLDVAPGAGNGVQYQFKKGATAAAANAATASVLVDISGTATTGTLNGTATTLTLSAGDVMVIKAVATGSGVGAAEHTQIAFQAQ